MRSVAAVFLASTIGATASGSIIFDLAGIDEYGTGLNEIGSFESSDPGQQIDSISLIDGVLETYNNTGTANFANEAILAVQLADADGDSVLFYFFPFPDEDASGQFGPANLTIELLEDGYYIPEDGIVTAFAASIWNDGSGDAAGAWIQGQLAINLIPAPAGLALLAGAGVTRRRRRRTDN
tara:strand:+ start:1436 stop:1978 length:543 start_codon:yes stop_codon:yes gene_type:complete